MRKITFILLLLLATASLGHRLHRSWVAPPVLGPTVLGERLGLAGEFIGPLPGELERGLSRAAFWVESDPSALAILRGDKPEETSHLSEGYRLWAAHQKRHLAPLQNDLREMAYDGLLRLLFCFAAMSCLVFFLLCSVILSPRPRFENETDSPKLDLKTGLAVLSAWVCLSHLSLMAATQLNETVAPFTLFASLQLANYLIVVCLLAFFWRWGEWRPFSNLDWRKVGAAYLMLLVALPSIEWAVTAITGTDPHIQLSLLPLFRGLTNSQSLILGVIAVGLGPILEELLFRGWLLQSLTTRLGERAALGLSSIVFALVHSNFWAFPGALFFGFVAGWLALRTKSLATSMALHILWNATTLCWVFANL